MTIVTKPALQFSDHVPIKKQKFGQSHPRQVEFDNCILQLYADGLPFSFIERPSFKKMINVLNPNITVKTRTSYVKKLDKVFEREVSLFTIL